jgi:nucleoside-diphosphate-sugar epimerase
MRVLVTGASGFVGRALVEKLASDGHAVRAITRREVPDIVTADWAPLLAEIDAVVHLAARVHRMRDASADPLAEFRRVNRDATLRLAEAAIAAGIRRFVFISSVKAAVDSTGLEAIDEDHPAIPRSDYGISKLEAEQGLLALAGRNGLEPVILRLPLVYGPGARGNLRSLFSLAKLGLPLPLAAIDNRRSLLGLSNLLQAIELAMTIPDLGGQVFYLEDATVSTPDLLRRIAGATGRPAWLFPVPPRLLSGLAKLLDQGDKYERLGGSLAISSARFRQATGWQPVVPMVTELEKIAPSLYS